MGILKNLFLRPIGLAREHHRLSPTTVEKEQLEAAIRNLKECGVHKIAEDYRSGLSQADFDACDQRTPWPSVRLVEAELDRIEAYLRPIFIEAGFPFSARSFLVRKNVELAWARQKGLIHQAVFGRLNLPEFFDIKRNIHGLILFEQTWKHKDVHGNTNWIGVASDFRYGRFKPLFDG